MVERVYSEEDFMRIALCCDSIEDIPEMKEPEKFYHELYSDLLDKVCFFYKQFACLFTMDFPWKNMEKIEQRLNRHLTVLSSGMVHIEKYVKAHLFSKKELNLSATVFVLSSLGCEKYLDYVLDKFIKVEEEYCDAFVQGLKRGHDKKITDKLFTILDNNSGFIKKACLKIIKYRNDYDPELFEPYHDSTDAPDQVQGSQDFNALEQLITEMESEKNDYRTRQNAWKEFVMTLGSNIPFEADWPVAKQIKSINMCREAINVGNRK